MILDNDKIGQFFMALDEKRFEDAERLLQEGYDALEDDYQEELFWLNNNAIYLEVNRNRLNEARHLGQKNVTLAQAMGNLKLNHVALHQLAYIEREAKEYTAALDYIKAEQDMITQIPFDADELALVKAVSGYEFAYLHYLLGDQVIAEREMRRALDLALKTDDQVAKACAYRGMGEVLHDVSYLEEAKRLFLEIGDDFGAGEVDVLMLR